MDAEGPGTAEITHAGVVVSLLVIHLADQFGDNEVEVRVALAVRVADHVDGHTFEVRGEVRAVVHVEAAQEILVGLAAARMLGRDLPGDAPE